MNTLEELKLKRQALALAINEIDELVALHEKLEHRVRKVLGQYAPDVPTAPVETAKNPQDVVVDQRRSVRSGVREFEQVVTEILTNVAEPMNRTALLQSLTDRGVMVEGKDPKNTLGARMSRMSSVTNVKGKGYWLVGRTENQVDFLDQNAAPYDDVATNNGSSS